MGLSPTSGTTKKPAGHDKEAGWARLKKEAPPPHLLSEIRKHGLVSALDRPDYFVSTLSEIL
jgi:hypothetical protein